MRQFVAARRRGDEAAAQRWWDELLTDNYDRVRGMVLLESRNRLDHHEQEEAFERALVKISFNMIRTFRGSTMGEWVESTRTLVKGVCIDTQRRAAVVSSRQQTLDATHDPDDRHRWDAASFAAYQDEQSERADREADAEELEQGRSFLDWAIPLLATGRRAVIELDRDGIPIEQIQSQLGKSRDAVYQARSRAMSDLVRLRDRYAS